MVVQQAHLSLTEIERRVCDIAADELGLRRETLHPGLRVIGDLNCDSLSLVSLLMRIEDAFGISLPDQAPNSAYKAVFTRPHFRLSDLAELVYLQQGSGPGRKRPIWTRTDEPESKTAHLPFTQLGGILPSAQSAGPVHQVLGKNAASYGTYRRMTDGMVCVDVPANTVTIGSDSENAYSDEKPAHRVDLDRFLIDVEPVSTTAYCRFLNSIGAVEESVLREWFVLSKQDHRREHELLRTEKGQWNPLAGTERFPMMLVSWYGANAYSLWAHRRDWRAYRGDEEGDGESFLPSEFQWEYAARGAEPREYPWGDGPPTPQRMRYARHIPGQTYRPEALPLATVNEELAVSPFGARHMGGNVWQWCRDRYAPYDSPAHPENRASGKSPMVRCERGGSWIGPAFLCRSSYRRGRVPSAKGRCLGFRCAAPSASEVKRSLQRRTA